MIEIESFEPYHIGTKLQPHVNLEILGSKLRRYLKDKQYEVPAKPVSEMYLPILPSTELLGLKENVRVEFNVPAQALNTLGSEPDRVIQVFKEVNQAFQILEYDLAATVVFYEIIATTVVKSNAHPRQKINECVGARLDFMQDLGEVVVDSLRIVNVEPTADQGSLRVTVEPSPTNPNTRYLLRVQFRCAKLEGIETFNSTIRERIVNIIKSIEHE